MKQYQQCLLRHGTSETVAWIESRGAKLGALVQVLPTDELCEVVGVYAHTLPEDALKEHQRLNRKSLLSVEPMGAPPKQVGEVRR